jgi:hypothetical protein
MARKVSAGLSGGAAVAGLQAFTTTLTSASNLDITVEPAGTGRFLINGNAQLLAQGDLRFADADSSNWVAFQSPETVASNITWTLPSIDGSNRQALTTNGSGTLSWQTPAVSIVDNITDSATHFVTLTTATTDTTIEALRRSSTRLTFQPSTGILTVSGLSSASVTITGGTINGTSVGATTASTGRFTSIVETSSITLKENISPIEDALDSILKLVGVTYDRKDGSSFNEPGLIAEQVEKVIPNIVTYKEGKPEGINYTKLGVYLIESVKSLKLEIEELKRSK